MDYSIGSIADLITGKSTPNKLKVITKQIENTTKFEPNLPETSDTDLVNNHLENESIKRKSDNNTNDDNIETHPKRPRLKRKKKPPPNPEELARTVFVGNLPITTTKNQLEKFFKKYGTVETVRFRNVTPADPKIPKKVALITKQLHPERKSLNAFVKFSTDEDARKATVTSGDLFNDHHIRVEVCSSEKQYDETKAIFVGNLPFGSEEEDVWKLFEPCGQISSVRMIRDAKTGIGKGFAYVNFSSSDSVQLALELEDVKLNDREVRISLCNTKTAKKNKKMNKVKQIGKPRKPRWQKTETKKTEEKDNSSSKTVQSNNQEFQGVTISKKNKKRKVNKAALQKKKLIKQLTGNTDKKNV